MDLGILLMLLVIGVGSFTAGIIIGVFWYRYSLEPKLKAMKSNRQDLEN